MSDWHISDGVTLCLRAGALPRTPEYLKKVQRRGRNA